MKYNLVAILDSNSEKDIISVQKYLIKKNNLPLKNVPSISIPLATFEKSSFISVDQIIGKLLCQLKVFKISYSTVLHYNENYKNFSLKVDTIGFVSRINRFLMDNFVLNSIKPFSITCNENNACIPIINSNTENKNLENFDISHVLKKNYSLPSYTKIIALEICRNTNQKDVTIKSYPLKEF